MDPILIIFLALIFAIAAVLGTYFLNKNSSGPTGPNDDNSGFGMPIAFDDIF